MVCAEDLSAETDAGESTAMVVYQIPTATDNSGDVPVIICNPQPGSNFTMGETTVTCSAIDGSRNIGTCDFQILVKGNYNN